MSRRAETLGGDRWVLDVSEEGARPFRSDVLGSSGRERTGVPWGGKQTVIVNDRNVNNMSFSKAVTPVQKTRNLVRVLQPYVRA